MVSVSNLFAGVSEVVDSNNSNNAAQQNATEKRIATLKSVITSISAADDKFYEEEPQLDPSKTVLDLFDPAGPDNDKVIDDEEVYQKLFSGCTFFLGREVPRESLEFVIRSCGGVVSWEGLTYDEADPSITHHVVDRPTLAKRSTRYYVQPQWIYDSVNARKQLPVELYLEGKLLPPHLSPFVDPEEDEYLMSRKLQKERKASRAVDEENELVLHRKELEAERAGISFSSSLNFSEKTFASPKKKRSAIDVEAEEKALARIMMPRKHKKLYTRMMV
ncbi:hypothetical protein Zmor_016464 [Zophobas morio]|uniref:BRCT domain-containing protein n=1 Tax=Zophobas morio TaxID=2755281 RepID=A0AA38HP53_9CUCU|nr:hypothetical protein Zmor_016464 [Zophobas morio]